MSLCQSCRLLVLVACACLAHWQSLALRWHVHLSLIESLITALSLLCASVSFPGCYSSLWRRSADGSSAPPRAHARAALQRPSAHRRQGGDNAPHLQHAGAGGGGAASVVGAQERSPAGMAGGVGGATDGAGQPAAVAHLESDRVVWKAGSGGSSLDLLLSAGSPERQRRVGGGLV